MRRQTPLRWWALVAGLALIVAACGDDDGADPDAEDEVVETETEDEPDPAEPDAPLLIGYAGLTAAPFVTDLNRGLEEAAAEAGAELIVLDNQYDPQVALDNADVLVQRGVDVVIEFQTDESIAPALCEKFAEVDLDDKVIAIDIPHQPCAAFYGANNALAGEIAGENLARIAEERWGEVGKLVLLGLPQSGELVLSRTEGYVTGVQNVFPDFSEEDVIRLDGQGLLESCREVMQDALARLADDTHILLGAVNDPCSAGALRAIQAAGRDEEFLIGGQNATIEARVEICNDSPVFVGSVGYFPELYGFDLVALALRLAAGEEIDDFNYIEHVWIDNANIRDFYPSC